MTGFPIVLTVLIMVLSPSTSVESSAWLLMQNHREEAKQAITRLYGEGHVHTSLGLLEPKKQLDDTEAGYPTEPAVSIWSPKYHMQFLGALLLSCTQQLLGYQRRHLQVVFRFSVRYINVI
jgi:hypothetical protein